MITESKVKPLSAFHTKYAAMDQRTKRWATAVFAILLGVIAAYGYQQYVSLQQPAVMQAVPNDRLPASSAPSPFPAGN